ncbi:hypothetical protein EDC65_4042 [Stella humosa]|uniref:Antitoxin FitA-like ribbon-helix-helix domain-containing protein n=1 Tax=Stella humosa TaxID=94 RepID=A0A3N1KZS5_9PROT|nr:toxin-antitoxin system [Stella humosa]ROP84687.1 hypothetical protein EDC65_4042 [Stella humosa]BBK34207.1 hypothetical protein STHU_48410 [Stella humosa]
MAQLTVGDIDQDVMERLRALAQSRGQSLEATVREVLGDAVRIEPPASEHIAARIARRFQSIGLDEDLPEFKGTPARPMDAGIRRY